MSEKQVKELDLYLGLGRAPRVKSDRHDRPHPLFRSGA